MHNVLKHDETDPATFVANPASFPEIRASLPRGTFGVHICRRLRQQRKGPGAAGAPCACLAAGLKALCRVADNSFVQRSALITGVLLASSGAMLGGVGYWVSGGFDYLSASASYDVPGIADYDRSRHMPAGLSGTATVPDGLRFPHQRSLHLSQERSRSAASVHGGG